MRLTYKKLAQLVSDKLNSVEYEHAKVECYNPRHRSDDIEAGACLIVFRIFLKGDDRSFSMLGFQWISDIQHIVNSKSYKIIIDQRDKYTLVDAEIRFVKI